MTSRWHAASRSPAPFLSLLTLFAACLGPAAAQASTELQRVSSAKALKQAVESGATHIQITEHLDLTDLPALQNSLPYGKLFNPGSELRSVTVRARRHSAAAVAGCARPAVCHLHAGEFFEGCRELH
jgi:hypothetical protein